MTTRIPEAHKVQNTSIVNTTELASAAHSDRALMEWITSAELLRDFSRSHRHGRRDPVVITRNRRDRLVLLGVERYSELKAAEIETAGGMPDRGASPNV